MNYKKELKNYPRVSIIILNWNGWRDTIECIESLYHIIYPNYDVILIDNDSKDESIQKIREYCDGKLIVESKFFMYDSTNKPIKLIEYTKQESETVRGKEKEIEETPSKRRLILIKNDKNDGFAEGNNIGIRYAMKALNPDYILLLNNDTVVDKEFLVELVKVAESDEKIGIVGPKIYYYDINGQSDIISFEGGAINWIRFPGYYHIGDHIKDLSEKSAGFKECEWITGTAIMIKMNNLPIKLLNNEFFFGCEDVDLCINIKEKGYKIMVVLSSKVWHKCGVSRKKRYKDRIKGILIDMKTNFIFIKKHNQYYILYLPIYVLEIILTLIISLLRNIYIKIKSAILS